MKVMFIHGSAGSNPIKQKSPNKNKSPSSLCALGHVLVAAILGFLVEVGKLPKGSGGISCIVETGVVSCYTYQGSYRPLGKLDVLQGAFFLNK